MINIGVNLEKPLANIIPIRYFEKLIINFGV